MTTTNAPQNRPIWLKAIPVAGSIFIFLLLIINFDMSELQDFIGQYKDFSLFISFACYFLLSFTFIPTTPLIVFMSILSDPISAAVTATLGNTLAAVVQYHIGTTVTDIDRFKVWQTKLPLPIRKLPISSPLFLLAGRFMPGGPRVLSIICGAYQVPISTYLWTSTVAYLISASFFAFGGTGLATLFK